MSNKLWIAFVCASAALATTALTSPDVTAADRKTLPGAACQPTSPLVAFTRSASAGTLLNDGDGAETFVCPVVRDYVINTIHSARVWLLDRHDTADAKCRVHSRSKSGTAGYASGWKSTSGSSSSAQRRTFDALGAYDFGAYHIECSVPGVYSASGSGVGDASRVVVYDLKENDGNATN